ncbi:MAG TPA: RES family NAD+ phosphorylase [Thermoanaerobaculia bacterium]|jgi:RES domain-containing protein
MASTRERLIASWRLTKARHAAAAFDGEGARRAGGRWNSPGYPVVYTSASASLAALEIVVHVPRSELLASYVVFACELPESLITRIALRDLPPKWQTSPVPPDAQAIGDEWLRSGRSAVLEVPSAVVESESNYLLNPAHRDFARIRIGPARPFLFDSRLAR